MCPPVPKCLLLVLQQQTLHQSLQEFTPPVAAPVAAEFTPPVATPSIPPAASPPVDPPAMPATGTEAALSSPEHTCKCGRKHPKTPDFMSADLIRLAHCVLDPTLRAALTRHTEGKSRADLDDRCQDEDFFITVERLFNSDKVFENPFVGDDDFGGTLNHIGATMKPVPHDRFSGTLKTKWQEARSQVTVAHSNYERSGQNTSDRLKFVGNAAQLYVWKLLILTNMFGAATRAIETDLQGERGLPNPSVVAEDPVALAAIGALQTVTNIMAAEAPAVSSGAVCAADRKADMAMLTDLIKDDAVGADIKAFAREQQMKLLKSMPY
ncbi:hypothetical protein CYMTET_52467 [Cymbomonas tetramitiformis]|uniref:Uncharacterized protein n=1 Tax=Cymbomonas tetramitiformis TaxID=36881 RepID=A0AAE0BKT2_9CHLO|nr:hypothetical protein CYMTET_52467 [Cymbomonas tetramitiformis]